ncbi:MAG TPA: cbb3-type cytochrome c oxidase subunit I [Burkholderiales bacterium]
MNREAVLSDSPRRALTSWDYALPVPADARRALAAGWLILGVVALIASGVFSILLVLSRAPYVKDVFPLVDFFHVALVVHVDLSVLVWFIAFAGVLWSLSGEPRLFGVARAALALAVLGTALMAVSPFAGRGAPVIANYIPVLDGPVFLAALVLVGAGFLALVVRALGALPSAGAAPAETRALSFGLAAAAASALLALAAFAWSWSMLPGGLEPRIHYELLFWGGGHTLQFTWALLMMVAWLWLAGASGGRVPLSPRLATALFALSVAPVLAVPWIYLAHDITSPEHHRHFTQLMWYGGGIAMVPFTLAVALGLARRRPEPGEQRVLRASLICSMALFCFGGLIGFLIEGSNVKIPAHYHGSIVGITLALMGFSYYLLPRLGFGEPGPRLAMLQPYVYGGGQLLHIVGLLWSGGYGVQRKVAGAEQALRTPSEIAAMGLMGLGGLIAVIGGLLFLVVVLRAMARRGASAGS